MSTYATVDVEQPAISMAQKLSHHIEENRWYLFEKHGYDVGNLCAFVDLIYRVPSLFDKFRMPDSEFEMPRPKKDSEKVAMKMEDRLSLKYSISDGFIYIHKPGHDERLVEVGPYIWPLPPELLTSGLWITAGV